MQLNLPQWTFYFPLATLSKMYALVLNGGIVEWISQDWMGEEQWEGATVEKRGEIVIIRLEKKMEGRDGGQRGCYKGGKRLFRVEQ